MTDYKPLLSGRFALYWEKFGNVVFGCGPLYEEGKLKIYYGAADTAICYAEILLQETIDNLNL
jgi:predicted GH43/DUF377 family glycosyl hydrolase